MFTSMSTFLPILSGIAGIGFLGVGAAYGVRRSLTKVHAEELAEKRIALKSASHPPTLAALAAQEIPGGLKLGQYAARAFLYGTALCLTGGVVSVLFVGWALGVKDAQGFTDKMLELMPSVKNRLMNAMGPTMESVAGGGRSMARAADRTVGSAVRSTMPALSGPSLREDELKGLSKKDRKAVQEFMRWLEGEGTGGTDPKQTQGDSVPTKES